MDCVLSFVLLISFWEVDILGYFGFCETSQNGGLADWRKRRNQGGMRVCQLDCMSVPVLLPVLLWHLLTKTTIKNNICPTSDGLRKVLDWSPPCFIFQSLTGVLTFSFVGCWILNSTLKKTKKNEPAFNFYIIHWYFFVRFSFKKNNWCILPFFFICE